MHIVSEFSGKIIVIAMHMHIDIKVDSYNLRRVRRQEENGASLRYWVEQ